MLKYELQNILCSKMAKLNTEQLSKQSSVTLKENTSPMAQNYKQSKKQETENLLCWINKNQFWVKNINFEDFISAGAEQKVYLFSDKEVIKLNDAIYYTSWVDYFYNLLINNLYVRLVQ